jgi:cytochrome c oxidase assembly protein subunit 15
VFSAYARLTDAGLGCANWPACYEENAQMQRQPPQPDAPRRHDSWQWKLQNMVGLLLGILTIAVCGHSWQKRKELRQSPLLPTLLLALMVFLALFGIFAFSYLPRAVIVPIHLAGGVATLMLVTWIALRLMAPTDEAGAGEAQNWRGFARVCLVLVLIQIMLGGWVSSNFAALACTDLPLCHGMLLPTMDFSYNLDRFGLPLSVEKLTAIHWLHRAGALLTIPCLVWLSFKLMGAEGLRTIGKILLGLVVLQFALGISNVLLGLPMASVVLHNAVAMLLLVTLVVLNYKLRKK